MITDLVDIINNDINNNTNDDMYRMPERLDISKMIYKLEIDDVRLFECNDFIVYKHYVRLENQKQRSYLVKISKKHANEKISKCIFFFHGSRDLHWDTALLSTNMLSDEFITIYLQGNNQGSFNLEEPHVHKNYGYITYGENFFEIRDFADNFYEDLEYIKLVKKDTIEKYNFTKFYAVGHSNGGVFVCLFPVYLPNEFNALVSHQGGFGYDKWFNIPFEKMDETIKKPPIYFYTGSKDIHKIPCIQANQLFTNEGFDSRIFIEDGLKHTWKKYHEDNIYNYLLEFA
jgi:predicted esterase